MPRKKSEVTPEAEVTEEETVTPTKRKRVTKPKTDQEAENVKDEAPAEAAEPVASEDAPEQEESAETDAAENSTGAAENETEESAETEPPKKRGRKKKSAADYVNPADELNIQEDTFEKRRVHRATNDERKDIYDDEEVFSDFGNVAETEASKRQEEYKLFRDAARSVPKTILKGTIGSVFETANGMLVASIDDAHRMGKGADGFHAEGYFQVLIPVRQMFPYEEKQYQGEDGREELRKKLQRRIGSEIHFCVYDVQEKDGIVIASRLTAQALRVNKWYVKEDKDGMPKLFEGLIAQATVIEVHNSYLNIEIGGAEGTIANTELSYNHLSSLYDEYQVGDTFNVKIKQVRVFDYAANNQKYRLAVIDTSAKDAMLSPADKYFHQFHVGEVCAGVIKAEANETGVFVCLKGKMDCLCPIPASKRVTVGSRCGVKITILDQENKRIFGEIVSI